MARTAFSGFNDDELRKIASRIGFHQTNLSQALLNSYLLILKKRSSL